MIANISMAKSLKSNDKLEFQEQFNPRLISALYKNFKDANSAILELIDNAIDDRIPGRLLVITIEVHGSRITVINKGGKGMGPRELEAFFIWGLSEKRGKLGRYGQGGKAAMGYLGKSWRISATKAGENEEYVIEEKDWDDRSGGMKRYVPVIEPARLIEDGVVQIDVWNLKKRIHKKDLAKELSNVYRPLIQSEQVRIIVNGKRLTPLPIPLEMPEEQFSFNIEEGKSVSGWLSILESGSSMRGGVRCYEYGRLIADKEFFGQKGPSYKESLDRLIGELYIDFEIPLVMNKTDFDRDSKDWKKIQYEMQIILEPYIEILLEEKERDLPTEKEKKAVEHAGDIWKDFLKYLQYQQKVGSLPGLSIDVGQKPPIKVGKDIRESQQVETEIIEKRQYSPATPPPIDKIGKRKRTGGYLRPVPKSLPEPVRYQIDEENGEKIILINTRFPSYKLRKNQLRLYVWETMICEYAKAEDAESQTVNEYIEDMNEMLRKLGIFIKTKNIKISS